MLRHQRALEAENHIKLHNGHRCDLGDIPALTRADLEDSLIQALDDTHCNGRLDAFREWARKHGGTMGIHPDLREAILHMDHYAWFIVHLMTCDLKRMAHRWQHSANKLWKDHNIDPQYIPQGNTLLGL